MSNVFSEYAGMEVEVGSVQAQLGDCLGEGAEGAVYGLQQLEGRVVKIFKEDKREDKHSKLGKMVQDSLISPEDQPDVPWTAWPIELVFDSSDESFLGYAMPYLDTDQRIEAQRYASQNLRWDTSTRRERYKPAVNLTLTVYWLHKNGYAIGDLSEQNIRVNDGTVTLIDCDSYSIEGSDFAGNMEAPRYTPPEGRGTTHEEVKRTDQFGVTVHVFQFLMAGFHPYQAVGEDAVSGSLPEAIQKGDFPYGRSGARNVAPPPAAPDYARLPKPVRRGFEQCFSEGQKDPSARPSLKKWLAILSEAGGFDIEGVDSSAIEFSNDGRERLDSNWQEDIRRDYSGNQTGSTSDTRVAQADTSTTTASPGGDTHWADNLRDDQTTQSVGSTGQQSANQQTVNQISLYEQTSVDERILTVIIIVIIFIFLMIILL